MRDRALRTGQYKTQDLPEIALDRLLLAMLGELNKLNKLAEGQGRYDLQNF